MTTWTVLKNHGAGGMTAGWVEMGTHESDSPYWLGPNTAQGLGEAFGAGEFLLLSDDERYKRITVGERTEFYEVETETEDNSPPLNAEQIVEQTT